MKSNNPRDKFIKFYINDDELKEIKKQISGIGYISISEYCRNIVLGKKVVSNIEARYIHELSSLGAKLNKLGGLQKELFNNAPSAKSYAGGTAKILVDIGIAIAEITKFVRSMKSASGDDEK